MIFDSTISAGNLLTMASFLVFVTVYVVNMRGTAKVFEARLLTIDQALVDFREDIKKLNNLFIQLAQQDARLSMMDERILATGKRLDDLIVRFNARMDKDHPR